MKPRPPRRSNLLHGAAILTLLASPLAAAAAPEKVIFGTDSGFFGDDGAALVILLRHPERVQVLGLTIEPGNVWPMDGARYMAEILRLAGHPELRIHLGAQAPLVFSRDMAKEFGRRWGPVAFDGAFSEPDPKSADFPRDAVNYLIQTIEANAGGVTIMAAGPMTNLAIALRMKPEIAGKIRRIVWMGGSVGAPGNSSQTAEFNFWFDPEAAQAVLRSEIPEKVMFGLEVCDPVVLDKALFDQIAAGKSPLVQRFREDFGNRYPGFFKNPTATVPVWDAVAAAYLVDPSAVAEPSTEWLDVASTFNASYGTVAVLDRSLAPRATPVKRMVQANAIEVMKIYRSAFEK